MLNNDVEMLNNDVINQETDVKMLWRHDDVTSELVTSWIGWVTSYNEWMIFKSEEELSAVEMVTSLVNDISQL